MAAERIKPIRQMTWEFNSRLSLPLKLICFGGVLFTGNALSGIGDGDGDFDPGIDPGETVSEYELNEASRFASQSTFGLRYDDIEEIAITGRKLWLEEQFNVPPTLHTPIAEDLITRQTAGEWEEFVRNPLKLRTVIHRFAWWQQTMTAEDVVRQRVAYSLSQFFVVSDRAIVLRLTPYSLTSFYDLLLENAFGNFRDLLKGVALSPAMGHYLSHANNRKANPARNRFPDENFAREVMQLFSIGLYELDIDGTLKLDADGEPIPTYDNDDIREMAKIFTGLTYAGEGHYWGRRYFDHTDAEVFSLPMIMYENRHEPGEKVLIDGTVVPAGQPGMDDVEAAIDVLFNHPNVGPFFCKQLIQRLVTSNPSPEYVERVARAFNGETGSPRGDMKAVLRAIFFDPEAEIGTWSQTFGRLKEPVVRIVSLARIFNYTSDSGEYYNTGYWLELFAKQHPLASPSVFNFYQPDYSPVGEILDNNMVAPEFQITTSTTVIGITNYIGLAIFNENQLFHTFRPHFEIPRIDLREYEELATKPDDLIKRLDIVLTQGQLSQATKNIVKDVLDNVDDVKERTQIAIYLILISPDSAVED
ncbi:MAG: DUF1800 domain-containing protein [Gammaproteobacteria bacterium]|nr:DUF1800 domain-containing protein [Gammaproteobacteria bacterium]